MAESTNDNPRYVNLDDVLESVKKLSVWSTWGTNVPMLYRDDVLALLAALAEDGQLSSAGDPPPPDVSLKRIADEVRGWPAYLRTSSSAANAARERERP